MIVSQVRLHSPPRPDTRSRNPVNGHDTSPGPQRSGIWPSNAEPLAPVLAGHTRDAIHLLTVISPAVRVSRSLASVPVGTRKGVTMAESEPFERGLQARRDVLGAEYVD